MSTLKTTSGFIDAHSHLRSTTLTEQLVSGSGSLEEALLRMSAMSSVDEADDSLIACADLLRAGVTGVQTVFHTFGSPQEYLESLTKALSGIERSGIRALVILGITDQAEFIPTELESQSLLPPWLPPKRKMAPEQFAEVYTEAKKLHPTVRFGVAPVGPQWCSVSLLGIIRELTEDGARIHSHLLESQAQRNWIGENPLTRLSAAGLLGSKTSLAHGVWCDAENLNTIRDAGAQLVTCPGSNATLSAGKADLALWEKQGVMFGFGIDSSADEVLPFKIACKAMSEEVALRALTEGGRSCTDLPTDNDLVEWEDFDAGIAKRVLVGEKVLFDGKALHNLGEVDAAKARAAGAMEADRSNRSNRKTTIDALLPNYLKAIKQCCG
jgi:cytosine/adenosine deaminase-related metal-dependent hydrolase